LHLFFLRPFPQKDTSNMSLSNNCTKHYMHVGCFGKVASYIYHHISGEHKCCTKYVASTIFVSAKSCGE
jgi:hypothetical protein